VSEIKVVLFDLGGVLLELRDPFATFGLQESGYDFHARWLASPTVRAYERGHIGAEEFGDSMALELELGIDGGEFLKRFDNWIKGIYSGTHELLDRIPGHLQKAVLSNINELHWQYVAADSGFTRRIDRFFLSYRIGMIKPDGETFSHVQGALGCRPEEILFIDDNPANVNAGVEAGFKAVFARGLPQVTGVLQSWRLLD
jgi:putative hydrolase of the HAD superfamily